MPARVTPVTVLSDSSTSGRARPKSTSFTPCGVRNTFDGFRSRWMMPRACSADRAASMPNPMGSACAALSGPRRRRSDNTSPSRSSMAMNSTPRVLADLVDLADVRMVDAGCGARLAPEPFARRVLVGERQHHFQRDRALQPFVARGIDYAHAAFAELVRNRIVADARRMADLLRRIGRQARRWGRSRCNARQPVVQCTQRPPRGFVYELVSHGTSRSYPRTPVTLGRVLQQQGPSSVGHGWPN